MRRWTLRLCIEMNSTATGTMNCARDEVGNLNSINILSLSGQGLAGSASSCGSVLVGTRGRKVASAGRFGNACRHGA